MSPRLLIASAFIISSIAMVALGRASRDVPSSSPSATPAVYATQASVVPVDAAVPAAPAGDTAPAFSASSTTGSEAAPVRRVARRSAATRYPARTTRANHRSWKKSAIVIGGSTAAGAGLGALVGDKKGALIGAAAGATGGTVYEVRKRHKRRR